MTENYDFNSVSGNTLSFYQHGSDPNLFVTRVYHPVTDSSRAIILNKSQIPDIIKSLEKLKGP